MHMVAAAILLLAIAGAAPAQWQPDESSKLLQRMFSPGEFTTKGFGPARWMENGAAYTTVEPAPGQKEALEIVRYATASGERSVLVSAAELTPLGAKAPLVIEDYTWSADGHRLLIFTNTKPVWRDNTRGDYWVLDRQKKTLRKLGGSAPESSLLFAKFSPDATRVAYVRQNNIYVEHLATGKIAQITRDGSETIINGTTDWVYEEELGLRDAFRWSPDGTKIAYWQYDSKGVGSFPLIYNTGKPREVATAIPYPGGKGDYPVLQYFPYPLAGTTNSAARVGVIPAKGGATKWLQVPGDPRNNYIARMDWAENSRELLIQHLNRLQNTDDVLMADAITGAVRRVHQEKDAAWVDVVDDVQPLASSKEYLWVSESSGWRHVYRMARDGGGIKPVTHGAFDAVDVLRTDEKGGWLYYRASPENATQRYLYRTRLDGSGSPERLTPASQPGSHSYQISPDGAWAFHTYSKFETPTAIDLVKLPEHKSIRMLQDNATPRKAMAELTSTPAEFFQVRIEEGTTFDAWMIRPPNFDASKKYPVLFYVYGEPAGQTVIDQWTSSNAKFHRAVASAGYIVASVDTRGTPAPKGRAWRKVIYGSIGALSTKEHSAAVREILRTRPYLDAARVGVWGWSGGGTSTLNLMFRAPDVYKAGMSVAPVPDQRLYDTIYQERYMGLPQENAEGYKNGSPINFAEGLQGKLLIVHGSGDDNVHIQGTELVVNRLIELGKPFDYFVYPERTHSISEGRGTTLHIYQLLLRTLKNYLPPGPVAR